MNLRVLVGLLIVLPVLLLAGCSSTGTRDGAGSGASVEDRGTSGAITSGARAGGAWTGAALDDPNSLLASRTIYFDFDQSTIRSEYIDILRTHAGFLVANRATSVFIEGHADERGSREYNIGLGERRANAVQRFLEAEGVDPVQINTISYGEERPLALGSDETSWAQNRRAELVY